MNTAAGCKVRGHALVKHGTILVVEDDSSVRDLVTRALSRNGYTVLAAATPQEARRLARELGTPPDLVLADVVLPGESGPELAPTLTTGGLGILFMSGYSEEHVLHPGSNANVLQKPFTIPDLLQAVERALGARPGR